MLPRRSSRARPAASPPAPKRRVCGGCGRSHSSASAAALCVAAASAAVATAAHLAAAVAAAAVAAAERAAAVQLAAAVAAAAVAAAAVPLPPPPAVPRTSVLPQAAGAFVAEIDLIKLVLCASCGEAEFGFSHLPYEGRNFVVNPKCSKCASKHSKHMLKFCKQNLMHLQPPPSDLPVLTDIEESLISLHSPVLRFFRLRGGSWGYGGSCVSITQSIGQVATRLPRCLSSLDLVIVTRVTNDGNEAITKNFRVRKSAVLAWLTWLITHNPLYHGVEIEDVDLPEDSADVLDHLRSHIREDTDVRDLEEHTDIVHSVIDGWGGAALEAPLLKQNIMQWPDRGADAIREFGCPNILAKCFPTVFPFGIGDPTSPTRTTGVSLSEGINHLQKFAFVRENILIFPFAQHHVAPYYAHDVQVF